jgi:hypothetical protein
MADEYIKADPVAWASALSTFHAAQSAHKAFTDPKEPGAREAFMARADAEEVLLDLQSPDLAGIIEKLQIIWGPQLYYDQSRDLQMVIGDLWRAILIQAGV